MTRRWAAEVLRKLAAGRGPTLPVGVGGRAADVLAVAEGFFVLGEAADALEPFLERVLIWEAAFVAP